jgi:FlgD Ig-like domain
MDLPVGTYTVTQTSQVGWNQTAPPGGSYGVLLDHGQVVSNRDFGNQSTVTGAPGDSPRATFSLSQNHPNPFNPVTTIRFSVAQKCRTRMFVYDVRGTLVATLIDRILPAGEHRVTWDGRDDRGIDVGSGVYFYHLEAGSVSLTRRMALLR